MNAPTVCGYYGDVQRERETENEGESQSEVQSTAGRWRDDFPLYTLLKTILSS